MSDSLHTIDLRGVEEWREYDWPDRTYRIVDPVSVTYRAGGDFHRVTDAAGIVHCVPRPGFMGCVLRWKGPVVA